MLHQLYIMSDVKITDFFKGFNFSYQMNEEGKRKTFIHYRALVVTTHTQYAEHNFTE